jgi:hypothetical protein
VTPSRQRGSVPVEAPEPHCVGLQLYVVTRYVYLTPRMFELTADDIARLGDEDLRDLVARLCESELRSCGISPDCVTSGGNQNAPDGGVDVRVSLPPQVDPPGFIPRPETGFQVKAEDTPASKIIAEMRPHGTLRPSIRQLAERSGAYVMVSSQGSTAETPLQDRREAMRDAVQDLPDPGRLKLDFYDRKRLETWLRAHSGTTLWVRERIGKPLPGWSGYGEWSFHPEAAVTLCEGLFARSNARASHPVTVTRSKCLTIGANMAPPL